MFNAFQNIQSNRDFYATEGISEALIFYMCRLHGRHVMETYHQNDFRHLLKYLTAFKIPYPIGRNHDAICKYKVHTMFTGP